MEKFNVAKFEIEERLGCVDYTGDVSDIGNEIGIVIGKYLDENNTVEDFIRGLRHGVSLANGTHS